MCDESKEFIEAFENLHKDNLVEIDLEAEENEEGRQIARFWAQTILAVIAGLLLAWAC